MNQTLTISISCVIASVLAFFVVAGIAVAGTDDNVYGYAWSENIGWIQLNNCSNPTNSNSCSGTTYGVEYNNGTFSGKGWNANVGYIDFGVSSSVFPNTALQHASAQTAGSQITTYGPSGWLGEIDMSGVSYNGPDFKGHAYSGEDLDGDTEADIGIGWIDFSAAKVVEGCTNPNASNYNDIAVYDDGSCTMPSFCSSTGGDPDLQGAAATDSLGDYVDQNYLDNIFSNNAPQVGMSIQNAESDGHIRATNCDQSISVTSTPNCDCAWNITPTTNSTATSSSISAPTYEEI